jgi:hypothetical protein
VTRWFLFSERLSRRLPLLPSNLPVNSTDQAVLKRETIASLSADFFKEGYDAKITSLKNWIQEKIPLLPSNLPVNSTDRLSLIQAYRCIYRWKNRGFAVLF